jgi:hypothetical protein
VLHCSCRGPSRAGASARRGVTAPTRMHGSAKLMCGGSLPGALANQIPLFFQGPPLAAPQAIIFQEPWLVEPHVCVARPDLRQKAHRAQRAHRHWVSSQESSCVLGLYSQFPSWAVRPTQTQSNRPSSAPRRVAYYRNVYLRLRWQRCSERQQARIRQSTGMRCPSCQWRNVLATRVASVTRSGGRGENPRPTCAQRGEEPG